MKKIAAGIFLIIFIFAVEVTYINYRLNQKLDSLELSQQNISEKIYSLERRTTQVNQTFRNALQKKKPHRQQNFLLITSTQPDSNRNNSKWADIN